jgi:hypothetical protein
MELDLYFMLLCYGIVGLPQQTMRQDLIHMFFFRDDPCTTARQLGTELRVTTLGNFSLIWKTSRNTHIWYNFLSPESEVFARSFLRTHRQCEMLFQRMLLGKHMQGWKIRDWANIRGSNKWFLWALPLTAIYSLIMLVFKWII